MENHNKMRYMKVDPTSLLLALLQSKADFVRQVDTSQKLKIGQTIHATLLRIIDQNKATIKVGSRELTVVIQNIKDLSSQQMKNKALILLINKLGPPLEVSIRKLKQPNLTSIQQNLIQNFKSNISQQQPLNHIAAIYSEIIKKNIKLPDKINIAIKDILNNSKLLKNNQKTNQSDRKNSPKSEIRKSTKLSSQNENVTKPSQPKVLEKPNIIKNSTKLNTVKPAQVKQNQIVPINKNIINVETKNVQQAIENSGIFLEAKMRNSKATTNDLKTKLLRLAKLIQLEIKQHPSIPETKSTHNPHIMAKSQTSTNTSDYLSQQLSSLLKATSEEIIYKDEKPRVKKDSPVTDLKHEANKKLTNTVQSKSIKGDVLLKLQQTIQANLARITLSQISSIIQNLDVANITQSTNLPQSHWSMDLPTFREGQFSNIQMEINKDSDTAESADINKKHKHKWTVMLHFDLENIGKVQVKISLINDKISTFFFSKDTPTTKLIHENLHYFKERLQEQGIDIKNVLNFHGMAPQAKKKADKPSMYLLDLKA